MLSAVRCHAFGVALALVVPMTCLVQTQIHELRYIYTALSKPISQPGVYQFAAMGMLDDRPIDFYNSEDKVMKPMQKWMEEHNGNDYWDKGTQSRKKKEQGFNNTIKILMEQMHQNKSDPDVHILQSMHGCQVEKKPDGSLKFLKSFDEYGYDGRDFLYFDHQHMAWEAAVTVPESTKQEWENEPILSQYTKEEDCVPWLEKFVTYQEQELQTFSPPEVYIFAKKSTSPDNRTLVCLATGFYLKDAAVDILKNGKIMYEWDRVISSKERPNGDSEVTYQLRKVLEIKASDTSKYSCRIHHRTLSPIEEFWDGKCSNCDSGNTGAIIGGIVVFLVIFLVICFFLARKRQNQPRHPEVVNGNDPDCESERLSPGEGLTAVKSERNGSKGSLDSVDNDSGKGPSKDSKEDVSLDNAEGEREPQPVTHTH